MNEAPDLFDSAFDDRLRRQAPLAARLRPRTLDDVVGQRHLIGPGAPLRALADADRLGSMVLWGPPGSGKTTLARVLSSTTAKAFVPLSAVESGVRDLRGCLDDARRLLGEHGQGTILFVDEVHRFNKAQQDILLPAVEDGLVVLIGATTENPYFEVNAPLLSRSRLWRLEPIGKDDLAELAVRGLAAEGVVAGPEAVSVMVGAAHGDARSLLGTIELAAAMARSRSAATEPTTTEERDPVEITTEDLQRSLHDRALVQDRDAHFDQVSALIKSVRGSDPDAGLYWLARMLEGGEDPRFIVRRLLVLASEDIGMADSKALSVAAAASRAVESIGLPEAALTLAHAVIYLACAPKSNSVTVGLASAREDVRSSSDDQVPVHLRDAHYRGATELGHGAGYRYPHDDPRGWVDQQYRPQAVEGHVYYRPSDHGEELDAEQRLRTRRLPCPAPHSPAPHSPAPLYEPSASERPDLVHEPSASERPAQDRR
ncbi:MAG: replication-associated recombination protein A [Actinomycetota bacterium]|nr:replication-associated recombination protein A [Actinomycetota bacterium]